MAALLCLFLCSVIILMPASPAMTFMFFIMAVVISIVVATHQNNLLIVAIAVACIPYPVIIEITIRVGIPQNHLITRIQVIAGIPAWKRCTENPMTASHVYKLTTWNVIIGFYIRQIVVFRIIISHRAPGRLIANINMYAYTYLCLCGMCCEPNGNKQCHTKDFLFHSL